MLLVLVLVPLLFSHSLCLHDFRSLGSYVAVFLFWERAAHLLNRMFSFYHVYLQFLFQGCGCGADFGHCFFRLLLLNISIYSWMAIHI